MMGSQEEEDGGREEEVEGGGWNMSVRGCMLRVVDGGQCKAEERKKCNIFCSFTFSGCGTLHEFAPLVELELYAPF